MLLFSSPLFKRLGLPIGVTVLLALTAPTSRAQGLGAITGLVQTPAAAGLELATITLHRTTDSAVVKNEFSDAQGRFRFDQVRPGRYLVSASQVGFVRRWSAPTEVTGHEVDIPALVLSASGATQLKEVTVVGQKPLFEHQADRTVVNVAGSTLAAGNTTLDVLARAPGVTVDGNDNLALRGKQGLLVLIDGKRQPLSGSELAEYLRALPAEQLQSIELITNPPAKYDAQGGAGIIAINLKKDQRQGTNGSANAAYGRGQYGKFTGGLSLNHRHQKLNLFGSYNYANRQDFVKITNHRDFSVAEVVTSRSDLFNKIVNHTHTHTWKAGLDYTLSERTVIGAVVSGLRSHLEQAGYNTTQLFRADQSLLAQNRTDKTRDFHSPNGAANLNFRHTFAAASGKRELSADVDYARYTTDRQQHLNTFYEVPVASPSLLRVTQAGALTIQSVKVDYTHPVSKEFVLEAGGKASRVSSDNDVVFLITRDGRDSVDVGQTNHFRYTENIYAGYLDLTHTYARLTLQAGLRAEQTQAIGNQVVGNVGFRRNYAQLFPSAAAKQTINDKHEVSLSLSRRIDRPSYGQLNPFRIYSDPTTSGAGNPNLRPQTSYNLELTHTYKQKFSTGLSYSITSNPIVGVVQPEAGNKVVVTSANLGKQYYYALTLTAPVELAKWWSVYNNGVFYYSRFVGHLAGTALDKGRPAFNLSSTSTLTFGQGWSAELNGRYQSREQYGFLDTRPNGQVGLGLQKAVWNRKGTLKLNATDLFYTATLHATSTYDNYVESLYQRLDTRVATLSFSYRFGSDTVTPARKRTGSAEDEKRRAG
ncbi:TonB-dependent receptor [Hymenobacter sp. BT491]|nr:TonB-dependent receptor [Hymenobacter sp. BT491]